MSTESQNSYFSDPESGSEMARLMIQEQILTEEMGGVDVGIDDPASLRKVLDIGCGPGGWALEMAFQYPDLEVIGIDISHKMIEYAQAQAVSRELYNASFRIMNALDASKLEEGSFDLINSCLLISFMHTEDWPILLEMCWKLLRPGGQLRCTEYDCTGFTNTLTFDVWHRYLGRAMATMDHSFSRQSNYCAITPMMRKLFLQAGFENVHRLAHGVDFSAGTKAHESMYQNYMVGMKLVIPFMQKAGVGTTQELDKMYQKVMIDMMREDFCAISYYLTTIGRKPF